MLALTRVVSPFWGKGDITLCGTNEQGAATTMKIFGVEILNEGSGVSIDDAVQKMQATFVGASSSLPGRRPFSHLRLGSSV
ncbi:hypothetical protein [Candidatus Korobacter versatilis]|uniref:hypothetical protein n=1 Tax=Candidatus Korobacter versatilis TaxID=658062 RepID=UPI0011D169DB|nr:hypothetical protein [Candidatus Koribacter versatilis]